MKDERMHTLSIVRFSNCPMPFNWCNEFESIFKINEKERECMDREGEKEKQVNAEGWRVNDVKKHTCSTWRAVSIEICSGNSVNSLFPNYF